MLLELDQVTKAYPSPERGSGVTVLSGITLAVEAGQSIAIIGPSGSGKSTLLNLIGALDRPTEGRVSLEGRDLAGLDEQSLARVRNRKIGFVFQLHHLLPQLTVLENVLVPTLAAGHRRDPHADQARAEALLDRVGLREWAHHRPAQLSGGQRQRAAVVRALINEPRLLLADEPTGSLDQASAENIADLLVELNREDGLTLIVVTHATSLADRMGKTYHLVQGGLQ
ncbi:MAG TPA: ABC transporter ATP-binding protein [Phycisphaerales bacterium]|nr:ABC transporter ATP-binding protein [Phycisphaerales bacterium]